MSLVDWDRLEPRALEFMADRRAAESRARAAERTRRWRLKKAAESRARAMAKSNDLPKPHRRPTPTGDPIIDGIRIASGWITLTSLCAYQRSFSSCHRVARKCNGWTINRDGTITRVKAETLLPMYDRGAMHKEPRYRILLNRNTCAIKPTDLVLAKFGRITDRFAFHPSNGRAVAAIEQPDRVEVGLRLNLEHGNVP